ncbi:MAG: flagellar motor protein MotB [Ghiorsea sp.]
MTGYNRGNDSNRPKSSLIIDDDLATDSSPFKHDQEGWMVAYLDLMTLLLALFLVMGALSHHKAGISAQGNSDAVNPSKETGKPITHDASVKKQEQQKVAQDLQPIIASNSLGGLVNVNVQPGLIRLQMDARLLFAEGEAILKEESKQPLQNIANLFKERARHIDVEGHSDNTPIHTNQYQSNWSLSAARAVSVVQALIRLGIPAQKLHASAYADTRPLVSNASKEGRGKNRRVEFVIELETE